MRTIITFDISNDRKRYRATKVLKTVGVRVQKSVFEATSMPRALYLRIRSKLEGIVVPETDSLRYYSLCATCAARIEHFGAGPHRIAEPEDVEIL